MEDILGSVKLIPPTPGLAVILKPSPLRELPVSTCIPKPALVVTVWCRSFWRCTPSCQNRHQQHRRRYSCLPRCRYSYQPTRLARRRPTRAAASAVASSDFLGKQAPDPGLRWERAKNFIDLFCLRKNGLTPSENDTENNILLYFVKTGTLQSRVSRLCWGSPTPHLSPPTSRSAEIGAEQAHPSLRTAGK